MYPGELADRRGCAGQTQATVCYAVQSTESIDLNKIHFENWEPTRTGPVLWLPPYSLLFTAATGEATRFKVKLGNDTFKLTLLSAYSVQKVPFKTNQGILFSLLQLNTAHILF